MTDLMGPTISAGGVTSRPGETRVFQTVDTFFKDCSSPDVEDGTEDQAAWRNQVLAALRALIRGNGQTAVGAVDIVTENNADDAVILKGVQHLIQRGQMLAADDTGTADTIVVALSPAPPEVKKGMQILVKMLADNTGGACTLNLNGIVKNVKSVAGSNPAKGMLVAGQEVKFAYDGTNWQIISVYSEKVSFTPRAVITCAAIASLSRGVYATHNMSLTSSFNLTPVVSTASFTLPNGVYLFVFNGQERTNYVNNTTSVAHIIRMLKNGVQLAYDFESLALQAGQDQTTFPRLVVVDNVISTDVFTMQAQTGSTFAPDFNGASTGDGRLDIIRLGN